MYAGKTSSRLIQRYEGSLAKNNDVSTKSQSIAINGESAAKNTPTQKTTKRRKWKKPKDKPKRPLSAYNLFFRDEREKLIRSRLYDPSNAKKIGFAGLAQHIATKWKNLDEDARKIYENPAYLEQIRYKVELDAWKKGGKEAISKVICIKKLDEIPSESSKECEEQPDRGINFADAKKTINVDIIKNYQVEALPESLPVRNLKISHKPDAATQSLQQLATLLASEPRKNTIFTDEFTSSLLSDSKVQQNIEKKLVPQGIQHFVNNYQVRSFAKCNQQNASVLNLEQAPLLQRLSSDVDVATAATLQLMLHRYQQQQRKQLQQALNDKTIAFQKLLLLETARQERDNVQRQVALLTRQIQNIKSLSSSSNLFL